VLPTAFCTFVFALLAGFQNGTKWKLYFTPKSAQNGHDVGDDVCSVLHDSEIHDDTINTYMVTMDTNCSILETLKNAKNAEKKDHIRSHR
jgi:hypothetical protein